MKSLAVNGTNHLHEPSYAIKLHKDLRKKRGGRLRRNRINQFIQGLYFLDYGTPDPSKVIDCLQRTRLKNVFPLDGAAVPIPIKKRDSSLYIVVSMSKYPNV